ncbi:Hypothetical protein FKW44_019892, partial [Caligus rogercresseyi]
LIRTSFSRGRAAHKEEFALAKKDVPLAMEGLALEDEDFFPLQDSYFPVIPSLVVLRHNGNASESTSMSGWIPWGSDLNPPCEADDEEDDYSDWFQLQIEATDWKTIRENLKTAGKHFINLNAGFTK